MKVYCVSKNGKVVRWSPSKFLMNVVSIIGMLLLIWFLVSSMQILFHQFDFLNKGVHFDYPNWNAIIWFGKLFK